MDYFDGRIIGLTATLAAFIERNTFQLFCSDGIPSFNYPYRDAVNEGDWVDYSLPQAETRFQREGIRGANFSEEDRNTLIEQGLDPDEIDCEGTELERTVSNRDTLRRQWEDLMQVCHKDESGQYPGKTIVFAVAQNHVLRLASVFEKTPARIRLLKIFCTCTAKSLFVALRINEEVIKKNYSFFVFCFDRAKVKERQTVFSLVGAISSLKGLRLSTWQHSSQKQKALPQKFLYSEADMPNDDSQTPYDHSQRYPDSQASRRTKLNWIFLALKQDKNLIERLLQEESVEAKYLADASELSRSAVLNRLDKLVEKGLVHRRVKPGTENRHKPPYIFSLDPDFRSQVAALLQEKGVERQEQPKQDQIEDGSQDLQLDQLKLSSTDQQSQQLGFSNEIVKEELGNRVAVSSVETNGTSVPVPRAEQLLDNATEQKQDTTSKFDEETQSLDKRIGIVLTKMAKEIEALRNRVASLERKLEQKTQNTDGVDFDQILGILERKQNDKDTT